MTDFRLWYPQLDVHDCIRRMLLLISTKPQVSMTEERLHILDFFFANPPLLHLTSLPRETRNALNKLDIRRPKKAFLSYPASPILFSQMESLQSISLRHLVAKGFVDLEQYRKGFVTGVSESLDVLDKAAITADSAEEELLIFLSEHLKTLGTNTPGGLKHHTGLWRVGT